MASSHGGSMRRLYRAKSAFCSLAPCIARWKSFPTASRSCPCRKCFRVNDFGDQTHRPLKSPAGLDLGAIAPEEIAPSISARCRTRDHPVFVLQKPADRLGTERAAVRCCRIRLGRFFMPRVRYLLLAGSMLAIVAPIPFAVAGTGPLIVAQAPPAPAPEGAEKQPPQAPKGQPKQPGQPPGAKAPPAGHPPGGPPPAAKGPPPGQAPGGPPPAAHVPAAPPPAGQPQRTQAPPSAEPVRPAVREELQQRREQLRQQRPATREEQPGRPPQQQPPGQRPAQAPAPVPQQPTAQQPPPAAAAPAAQTPTQPGQPPAAQTPTTQPPTTPAAQDQRGRQRPAGAPGAPGAPAPGAPGAPGTPGQQPPAAQGQQPPAAGQPPAGQPAQAPSPQRPAAVAAPTSPSAPPPAQPPAQPAVTQSGAIAPQPTGAQGQPLRRVDDIRSERREVREGDRLVIREPDRVIIREGNQTIIRHNETNRFLMIGGREVGVDRRGTETTTIVERPDGTRVITVTDDDGRLIRRIRRTPEGREVIIIDSRDSWRPGATYFVDLPPPVVRIPRERYIVEAARATPEIIYETLMAPPVERIDRRYTLEQIRYSEPLRERMSRVDLDTINFDTGSWEIAPDQINRLAIIGNAMSRAIGSNPGEVFLIEGHTDAVGSDVDNLSLSDRRAESAALALSQRFSIPAENLTTQGYGEQYLKVPSQAAERANRRVTVRRITPLLTGQNQSTGQAQ